MSEEEKKRLYVYVMLAAILSGGGSLGVNKFTSIVRDDPFTGKQGQALSDRIGINNKMINDHYRKISHVYDQSDSNSVRIAEMEKIAVTRQYFKDRCDDMRLRVEHIESDDEKAKEDIALLFQLYSNLPPDELIARVTRCEIQQSIIDKNQTWILDQFRGME
jgi:hypothetical protein